MNSEAKALGPAEIEALKIECVRDFMNTFETSDAPELWNKLVLEELAEAEEALLHLLKELADFQYVLIGRLVATHASQASIPFSQQVQRRAQTIAMVINGIENGLKTDLVDQAFFKVHMSNMSKLGPNGEVLRREDGKVLKGPKYQEPDLKELLG